MTPLENCRRKRRFKTKADAKAVLHGGTRRYFEIYVCECCGGFHIGHRKYSPRSLQKKWGKTDDSKRSD